MIFVAIVVIAVQMRLHFNAYVHALLQSFNRNCKMVLMVFVFGCKTAICEMRFASPCIIPLPETIQLL